MRRKLGWAMCVTAFLHIGFGIGLLPVSVEGGLAFIGMGGVILGIVLNRTNIRLFESMRRSIPPAGSVPRRDWLWLRSAGVAIIAGGIAFGELLHDAEPPAWAFIAASAAASWLALVFLRELRLINREQDLRRERLRELRRRYGSGDRPR